MMALVLPMAVLAPAFAADPFPDQPGALWPEEITAATNALRHITLSAAQYQLVASGRREPGSPLPVYAVFEYPPEKVTERIEARRRIVCNLVRVTDKWQCAREQLEVRVQAQGTEHVVSLVTLEGITDDGRTAGEIVDFMYSLCFLIQYQAQAGRQAAPPPPRSINSVIVSPGSVSVLTGLAGAEDTHVLEPNASGQACAFRLTAIHLGKGGSLVAQKDADVPPPPAPAAKARKERAEPESWSIDRSVLAEGMMLAALGCSLAALVLPWAVFVFSRRLAAMTAGLLALVGSILVATTDQGAVRGNIRMDLIIIPALLLVAWVECAWMAYLAARQPSHRAGMPARILLSIAGVTVAVVVVLAVIFGGPFVLGGLFW